MPGDAAQLLDMGQKAPDKSYSAWVSRPSSDHRSDVTTIFEARAVYFCGKVTLINQVAWRVNLFDPMCSQHRVGSFGIGTVNSRIYKEPGALDDTSLATGWLHDEIAQISPPCYVDQVYWNKTTDRILPGIQIDFDVDSAG